MEKTKWKAAFDEISLTAEEKEELWSRMELRMTEDGRRKRIFRVAAAVAAVCCISLGIYVAITGIVDGKLANAFAKLWKVEESSRKVIEETTDYYHLSLDSVYAPELIDCSETRVVFANAFGLVVYDKRQQRVTGTIDLPKIHCNYFNADTLQTRFLTDGDRLTVYNLSQRKVTGDCYIYELGVCAEGQEGGIKALEPVETKKASSSLEDQWKRQNRERRVSTFEEYDGKQPFARKMYSEYSVRWSGNENTQYSSCLVVDGIEQVLTNESQECRILLYHNNLATGEVTSEALQISTELGKETEEKERLPEYQYRGDDPVVSALVQCFREDLLCYSGQFFHGPSSRHGMIELNGSDAIVPSIAIVGVKQEGDVLKVYGSFRWYGYTLSGDTFYYSSDGGGGYGVACLKKTDDGYTVRKIVHPRDGSYIVSDMIELCDGDEELAAKCSHPDKKSFVVTLKQYVEQNNLDVRYVKDFGWDPEEI